MGNPLLDQYPSPLTHSLQSNAAAPDTKTIGLLPGSRKNEIHTLLGPMLAAAEKIHDCHPGVRILISAAESIPPDMIESQVNSVKNPELFQVISGNPRQIFERSDMLIAASGTITLEAALCSIPTVIVYKLSPLTYQVARAVVKVNHAGLANIIMNREVMPELLQDAVTPEAICTTACHMLNHLDEFRQKLIPGQAVARRTRSRCQSSKNCTGAAISKQKPVKAEMGI